MKDKKKWSEWSAEVIERSYQRLDPKVDLSIIQLVSPHTSKEELQSLYLEVYKQ